MPAFTTKLNLYLPGGGSTEEITPDEAADIDKLNQNFELLDEAVGAAMVTSVTLPASPWDGQIAFEKDTGAMKVWDDDEDEWVVPGSSASAFEDLDALDGSDLPQGSTVSVEGAGVGTGCLNPFVVFRKDADDVWRVESAALLFDTKTNLDAFVSSESARLKSGLNRLWDEATGREYLWVVSALRPTSILLSDTAPATPVDGQLWGDTS